MPCEYRIDEARRIVFSRAFDVVTDDDLVDHRTRLAADPDFIPTYRQLYDFTQVSDFRVTSECLRRLALSGEIFSSESKRALVTPQDVVYGHSRAFHGWLGGSPNNIRIFRDMVEARKWLELDVS